jgi:type II secretory pathway component PulK
VHRNSQASMPTQPLKRRGAIVVCVLVVLFIVGMLAAQSMQTSIVMRRGDAQHSQLRQARELVELGQIALAQRVADMADGETVAGEWEVALDDSSLAVWTVAVTVVDGPQEVPSQFRIVAKLPRGSKPEVTVTWENGR